MSVNKSKRRRSYTKAPRDKSKSIAASPVRVIEKDSPEWREIARRYQQQQTMDRDDNESGGGDDAKAG